MLNKYLDPKKVSEAVDEMMEKADDQEINAALIGGVAMQLYGSDRLTVDVDFVAEDHLQGVEVKGYDALSFGGDHLVASNGVDVDWVLRSDDYKDLYEEALENSVEIENYPVVTPEYLAAMKFATRRSKDEGDLLFLLNSEIVDQEKLSDIVYRLVGGQFALDELELVMAEADWRKDMGK